MPNLREIAAHAGLSKSAVSLALRDHPRIPAATRERVRRAARDLGYRPNPMFAEMMRNVRASAPVPTRAIIGILHGFSEARPGRSISYHAEWVAGARARGEELGYAVDELWMLEPGMSGRRLGHIIRSRGIHALMIAPLPVRTAVDLPWDEFTAVTAGYQLIEPRLSRVVPNHQQAMLVCLGQLAARGYRRIGLLLDEALDPLARFNLTAPYLWFQRQLPRTPPLPVGDRGPGSRAALRRWLRRHRPEAIITVRREFVDWIRAERIRVPEELGVVCTSGTLAPPGYCCVDQQPRKLGAAAVDLLIGQIHRGDRGRPANPKTVFTDIAWKEGRSLRRVGPPLDLPRLDFF